jgi:Peptidase family S41
MYLTAAVTSLVTALLKPQHWARLGVGVCVASALTACSSGDVTIELPGPATAPVLSRAAADVHSAAAFLEATHPLLNEPQARAAFAANAQAVVGLLNAKADATEIDVQHAIVQLSAGLNDFHLNVTGPLFQSTSTRSDFFSLPVRAVQGRLYVDGDSTSVPHGSEIATINGVSVSSILRVLENEVSADSTALSVRQTMVDAEFTRRYHQAYGFASRYVLTFASAALPVLEIEGIAINSPARARTTQPNWIRLLSVEQRRPTVNLLPGGIAHLKLATFGVADRDAFFRALDEQRALAKNARALIIDLRGNTGGYRDFGTEIINYLTQAPYSQYRGSGVRVRQIPAAFADRVRPLSPLWPVDQTLRGFPETLNGSALYWSAGDSLASQMQPKSPHFSGPIMVLIDGLAASAATQMIAALINVRADTVLIGEETAGHCKRHTGDVPAVFQTANFDVSVGVSLAVIELANDARCSATGGFKPDVLVAATPEAVLANEDPALKAAIARLTAN